MVVYASNTLRGGLGSESVTINLPVAATVSGYFIDGNITAWKLYGDDSTLLDQQSLQYTLKNVYVLPTIATTYTKYTIVATNVVGASFAQIRTFKLTNEYNTLQIVPDLARSSQNDYNVVPQNIILNTYVSTQNQTVYNSTIYTGNSVTCNVVSNIVCSNIFIQNNREFLLFGSKDRGTTWSNLIANNTSVTSNSDAFNCFRLLTYDENSSCILTDPNNNIININYSKLGGNYTGQTITSDHKGEWINIDFTSNFVYANSYSITFPTDGFASHWKVLGYNGGWNLLSEVSNIYSIPSSYTVSYPFRWPNNGYTQYRLIFVAMYGTNYASVTQFLLYDDMGKRLVSYLTNQPTIKTFSTVGLPIITTSATGTFIEFPNPVSVYKFANLSPCTTGTIIGYRDVSMTDSNICVNSVNSYVVPSSNTQPFKIFKLTGDYINSSSNMLFIGRLGQLNGDNLYGGINISSQPSFTFTIPIAKIVNSYTLVPDASVTGIPVSWILKGSTNAGATWTDIDSRTNLYNTTGGNVYTVSSSSSYRTFGLFVNEIRGSSRTDGMYFILRSFQMYDSSGYKFLPVLGTGGSINYTNNVVVPTNIDGGVIMYASTYAVGSSPTIIYNLTDYNFQTFFQFGGDYENLTTTTVVDNISYSGEYIQFQILYPIIIVKFAFATSKSPMTAPTTFILAASNDGITWTSLYSQTSAIPALGKNGTFTTNLTQNTTSYKYYRFIVRTIVYGSYLQLSMFRLYSSAGPILPIISQVGSSVSVQNIYGGNSPTPDFISIKTDKTLRPSYIYLESVSNCLPSNLQIQYVNVTTGVLTHLMYYDYYELSNTLLISITTPVTSNTFRITALSTQQNTSNKSSFSLSKYQLFNSFKQNLLTKMESMSSAVTLQNSNVYYTVNSNTNVGGNGSQYVTIGTDTPISIYGYYVKFTGGALVWSLKGSTNGTTWATIDSRIGILDTNEYRIHVNTTTPINYSYFRLTINNTFTGYESIGISEFYLINNQNDRITHYGSNICYSGSLYKSIHNINGYTGEYLTFSYSSPNQNSGINITSIYPIREVVLLGKTATSDWVYLSATKNEIIVGTFIFSGSSEVENPIGAFTNLNTIMSRINASCYVQIETPYPLKVTRFVITEYNDLYSTYDPVGNLKGWNISGSTDGVTFTILYNADEFRQLQNNLDASNLYKYYRFTITSVDSGINVGIKNIELFCGDIPLFTYNTTAPPASSVVNVTTTGVTRIDPSPVWNKYSQYALVFTKVETKTSAAAIQLVDFSSPNNFPLIGPTNSENTFNYPANTSLTPYGSNPQQYVILETAIPVAIQSYSFNSVKTETWDLYAAPTVNSPWLLITDTQYSSAGVKGGVIPSVGLYSRYKLVIKTIVSTTDIDGCVEIDTFKLTTLLNSCTFPLVNLTSNITDYQTSTLPGFRNASAQPVLSIGSLNQEYIQPRIVVESDGNYFQE